MLNRQIAIDILAQAQKIVGGPRAKTHGDNTFQHMAELASAYLGIPISPSQASWLMVLFKIARTQTGDRQHLDHYLDAAAYAALAGALELDIPSPEPIDSIPIAPAKSDDVPF